VRDALEPFLFAFAHVGAGVGDEVGDLQDDATGEFLDEELDALLPHDGVGGGEVDQVAVVADGLGELQALAVGLPVIDGGSIEGFALPLLLVLGEDLDGVEVELFGREEGVVEAAGDGEVGAVHVLDCPYRPCKRITNINAE
jgi:hypothetical protein